MSWHFSRALVAEFSGANSLDGEQSALLNGMSMPGMFSSPDKTTAALIHSQFGTTCVPSTDGPGLASWISFLADSRVRTSVQQEDQTDSGYPDRDQGSGQAWRASLAKLDRDSCSWKTHQLLLFGGLEPYSGTWPRYGMMRNGELYPLPMLEHDTSVREFGSWPIIGTPIKTQRCRSEAFMSPAKNPFELCPRGFLPSPKWVERLMGWPDGWTDLSELETGKFRKWSDLHGTYWPQSRDNETNQ
jgi:hypothetical protein